MNEQDFEDGRKHPILGPAYFDAKRVAESILSNFDVKDIAPLVKSTTDTLYTEIADKFENWLLSDAEVNVQGHIYRIVDESVKALITGKQWALDRYALNNQYSVQDMAELRAAILKHASEELKGLRIQDLEKEVETLRSDLAFYKNRGL